MKKWLALLMTALLSIGILIGCGNTEQVSNDDNVESNEQVEESTESNEVNEVNEEAEVEVDGAHYPLTITDSSGVEVTIEAKPETFITITPSNTEVLYALGLWDQVIGITTNDDFPVDAQETKEIVGSMDYDVEKILSLKPDLVLANQMNAPEGIEQLRNAGVKVIVMKSAGSFDDVYETIEKIALVTDTVGKGEEIIQGMKDKISYVQEKVANITEEEKQTVWVEISPEPEIYTTGKGTFMHEMLEIINAINAAGDQEGWPKFTEEDAVQTNPDVIITTYGNWVENPVEGVLNRSAWQDISAIKAERVYDIDGNLVNRPGPRLVEGVEKLAEKIYPEIFAQ